jgi:hypothetical protein
VCVCVCVCVCAAHPEHITGQDVAFYRTVSGGNPLEVFKVASYH